MKRHILALALISGCLVVAGCNTVRGFGEDLSSAGAELEKTN
jgi:predicted small secreted protein